MKVTRLVHSCLLVEDERANVLIDPGKFSWNDPAVSVDSLPNIDYILITHKHPDHCFPEFIQAVLDANPNAVVVAGQDVADALKESNITVQTEPPEGITLTEVQHAQLWQNMPTIDNNVITLWGELTHFGDSRALESVDLAPVVAFPIVAPWGSLVDAIDKLIENPPQKVIPIHDWHLSPAGQDWYNQRATAPLNENGIEVLALKPTESIEI